MLQFEFMQRAFWAGGMIALIAPVLGVYLILRRQALMADTLSHISLTGVAMGALLGWNESILALLIAVMGAVGIEYLRRSFRAYSEMSIAVLMMAGLAVSLVLLSLGKGMNTSFTAYLFGSVVAVSAEQLFLVGAVTLGALLYFFFLRRPLYVLTFDEETAFTSGLRTNLLSFSFSMVTGLTVAVMMPIVGVLLVSALMILPASLALRVVKGFFRVMVAAILFGMCGVFMGLTTSYQWNTPPGATISLVLLMMLFVGILLQKGAEMVSRRHKKSCQVIQ